MDDDLNLTSNKDIAIANQASELKSQGPLGKERAVNLLLHQFGRDIMAQFIRNRVPVDDAEELLYKVLRKFTETPTKGTNPKSAISLLWQIRRTVLIDGVRKLNSKGRNQLAQGGPNEVTMSEEEFESILDTMHFDFDLPGWVRTCVQRVAALFQQEKPRLAETLFLFAQGYSNREIAQIQEAVPTLEQVTKKQEDAAKSRVHNACKLAREYFKECKE